MAWLPLFFIKILSCFRHLSLSVVIRHFRRYRLVSKRQFVTPLPVSSRSNCRSFFRYSFEHADTIWNCLWSLVKVRQTVWVLNTIGLSQLIEINLTECKRVIVLEIVVFGCNKLRSRLDNLLAICKFYLLLGTVRYTLNGNHASCFPQLTNWWLFARLKRHSSC